MEKFELCYALRETTEKTWLATQLLPAEAPNTPWDNYKNLAVRYVFTFFMPKGLIPRFIVRNNQYVSNIGRAWKSGAEMTSGQTAAKVTSSAATNSIEIRVNDRGDFRAFLLTLMEDMDRLLEGFGDRLQFEKMLPCPCGQCIGSEQPHEFKLSTLRRRIEVLKKDTIECEKSGLDVVVKPFLDSFFGKKPNMKKVFISYSSKDKEYREKLEKHLSLLQRGGYVESWSDRLLEAGSDWDEKIKTALHEADVYLFLVSSDLLNSTYVWDVEVAKALEKVDQSKAIAIPVILRPCEWNLKKRGTANEYVFPFARYQALPAKARPVADYENEDTAFTEIASALRSLIDNMV